jgi:hypothetical protein
MATFVSAADKTVPALPVATDDEDAVVAEAAADGDQMIDPNQLLSTVVVTNLPRADQERTLAALVAALPSGVSIVSSIFQNEDACQHVVLILDSPASAERACGLAAAEILGTPNCKFIRAKNLNVPEGESAVALPSGSGGKIKKAAVGVTASAIVLGGSVLAKVAKVDQDAGISKTVNKGWNTGKKKVVEIDAQLGISAGVKTGAAATVNAAKELDEKYDVSGRTTRAASITAKAATDLAKKALENPTVSKSWGWMKSMASSAAESVTGALAETSDVVKQGREEAKARRSSNASPTGEGAVATATAVAETPAGVAEAEAVSGGEAKFVTK